jgi:hypothetical protein
MYNLLRNKACQLVIGLLVCGLSFQKVQAQNRTLHLENHDDKKYYLGIALMYNTSRFNVSHDASFLFHDSVSAINPLNSGGFGLAGMHTYRFSDRFEVRAIFPQLLFAYKDLQYDLKTPDPFYDEAPVVTKRVESIQLGLPVHLKFRSDRINNFRVYMFAGGKVEYDLSSNSNARKADDMIKLKKIDYGIEAGIGFNFYFPVFILSPEIKISNGVQNIHARDASFKYSSTVDQLKSRMIMFSLIFEG